MLFVLVVHVISHVEIVLLYLIEVSHYKIIPYIF